MKIKLIYPPRIKSEEQKPEVVLPPLAISILTSYLRKHNIKVEQDDLDIKLEHKQMSNKPIKAEVFQNKKIVYDYILKNKQDDSLLNAAERLLRLTNYKNLDLIGFSVMDNVEFSNISTSLVLSKLIKEKTGTKIVIGGNIHPFHNFQKLPFIDYVVKNDGREPLLQICDLIDSKTEKDYIKLKFYDKKEGILVNLFPYHKRNSIIISDKFFTIPDFGGLPLDLYTTHQNTRSKNLILPYNFGFGCINGCIFCPESGMACARFNKPSIVAEDLKYLSDKYKTRTFYFINTLINPTYNYADKICKNFFENKLDIKWTDCICFKNLDIKLLKKLREAGAIRFVFGLETGSKKLLEYIQKGITLEHAEKLLKHSHNLGIWNCVEIITGLPHEGNEDIKETLSFIKKNQQYVNEFKLNKFQLVYSELYSNPQKYGIRILPPLKKERFDTSIHQIRFKEIQGKEGNKKVKQIEESFEAIRRYIQDNYKSQPRIETLFQINMSKNSYAFIKNFYESIWGKNDLNESTDEKVQKMGVIKDLILKAPYDENLWKGLSETYETLEEQDLNKKIKTQLKRFSKMRLNDKIHRGILKRILLKLDPKKTLKQNPKIGGVLSSLGQMYYNLGEYQKSINYFKKALKKNQNKKQKVHIINHLIMSYYKTNQIKKIGQIKKQYLKEMPEMMALCYLNLKEYKKAKDELKKIKNKPLISLARCHWECKEYSEALKYYKKILKLNRLDPLSLRGIGECYTKLKDYNKALIYLKKAVKQEPKLPWMSFDLGKVYYCLTKHKKSIQYLEKELKNSQEELSKFHSLYYLTMNYQKLKNYKKANEYFRKVKKFKEYYNKEEIPEEKEFKKSLRRTDKIG